MMDALTIPEQIKSFNFTYLAGEDGKNPFIMGTGWQKQIHKIDCPILQKHIREGGNYGVQSNNSFIIINGKSYFLVVIDFDTKEFQDKIIEKFPETFTTTSGSPKKCVHLWFASDNNKAFKIKTENQETLADVIGEGNQVVAPGSLHKKSGSVYSVVKDIPIAFLPYAEIEAILRPHDKTPKRIEKPKKQFVPKGLGGNVSERILGGLSMEQVLNEVGIDTTKNPTNCFAHSSNGGKCLGWSEETAHCFHCEGSWNKFSLVKDAKNLTDKETFDWFAEKSGLTEELEKARKDYKKARKVEKNVGEVIEAGEVFSKIGQARNFFENQPGYYSSEGLWLFWNKERFCYEIRDEVDLLNGIRKALPLQADTIDSKERGEILASLKQVGRERKPQLKPKGWLQFKDILINPKTGEKKKASPEFLLMNPIPHKLGNSESTPTISRFFMEWVVKAGVQNESYIDSLEEASAYALTDDLFMQRLFPLTGGGCNGKGTYLEFMKRLVGKENCVSVDLKKLSTNNFAMSSIYKKLLAITGEVSHDDLKNTNAIKKLTGEDLIDFEFKGKTSFTDENVTTFFLPGNSLPITPDKSIGFYRRHQIIDFPNTFEIKNNILSVISEVEYENFCLKCVNILKRLYETNKFTNEGNYEQREQKYEERSNPLPTFIEENCLDEPGANIKLQEFGNKFNGWIKSMRLRPLTIRQIGGILRTNGYEIGKRKSGEESFVAVVNLKFNNTTTETTETTEGMDWFLRKKLVESVGSSGSSGSSEDKNKIEHCPDCNAPIVKGQCIGCTADGRFKV